MPYTNMKFLLILFGFFLLLQSSGITQDNGFTMQRWTGAWGSDGPIHTGDLNGDRKTDVFMWRQSDNSWTVNLSTGNAFTMQRWTGAWGSDGPINTGDLNGDGKTDVFMWRGADNSGMINLSTGNGFVMQRWTGAWGSDGPIKTGDLNGDGRTDVFMWRQSDNSWTVNLSTGAGFTMQRWTGAWGSDGPINTGDLNGDGKTDVFMWRGADNSWTINLSTGAGFNMQRWTGAWGSDGPIHVGDINGDRKTDVFMWRRSDNSWTVNISTGNGFQMQQWFGACINSGISVTGDFNGDNKLDVAIWNNNFLKWMSNLSTGNGFNFQLWNGAWGSDGPIRTGDLNGDGRTDIFMWRDIDKSWTVNLSKQTILGFASSRPECGNPIWRSLGPYTVKNILNYIPCGGRIDAIAISTDFDGQGHPAMFTGNPGGGVYRWAQNFPNSTSPQWEALTDHLPGIVPEELRQNINGVRSVVVAPNNPRMIIASTSSSPAVLLQSSDGGNNWSVSGYNQFQNNDQINSVGIDNQGRVYVATNTRIYVRENGGNNFTDITAQNLLGCSFEDIVYFSDEENNNQIYVAVIDGNPNNNRTGIWLITRNSNNQPQWQAVQQDLRNMKNASFLSNTIAHIKLSATPNVGVSASYTTAGNDPGLLNIFLITNNGANYKATPKWFTDELFYTQGGYDMGVCVGEDGKTYGGGIGLGQGDETGKVVNLQSQYNNIHVDEHVLAAYNGKIYAGTDGGLLRFTPQVGKLGAEKPESWEHLNSYSLQNFLSTSVAYHPLKPLEILAGHQDNGIAHLVNGEWFWRPNANEREFIYYDPHPSNAGQILYAYDESNLDFLKSKDGGKNFIKLFNTTLPDFKVAFHPTDKDRFIANFMAANNNFTVKETFDGLENVAALKDLAPPIQGLGCPTALSYAGNFIYVGAAGRIFRYDGESWATVFTGNFRIQNIMPDPSNPQAIYFATSGGIFCKPNHENGMAWTIGGGGDLRELTGSGLNSGIQRLAMLSNGAGKSPNLYAANQIGIFKLKQQGSSVQWVKLGTALPDTPIREFISNHQNRYLYLATYGRGVWYTQDLSE